MHNSYLKRLQNRCCAVRPTDAGTNFGGVSVSVEFDKPEAVVQLSLAQQARYWERAGRLSAGVFCVGMRRT